MGSAHGQTGSRSNRFNRPVRSDFNNLEKTTPSTSRKDGSGPRGDSGSKTQKPKGTTLSAVKDSKLGSGKGMKVKEAVKAAAEEKLKRMRETLEDLNADSSEDQPRGSKLQKLPEKKKKEKMLSNLTEADFEAVAKVAKLGAEAFKKIRATAEKNTPEKLKGMYLATVAYNRAIEVKLDRTSGELKVARSHWYVELLKENRMLREEADEKADLKKKLSEANTKAAKNKEKADKLSTVGKDLELTREDLERVWKEAEAAEVKSAARIAELEKRCQKLTDDGVQMAIEGYTRCMQQAILLEPNLRAEYINLTYAVEDGKIFKGEEVIFPPAGVHGEEVGNVEAGNTEVVEDANLETPANADLERRKNVPW